MLGRVRLVLALAAFVLATPVLALWQWVAIGSGLLDEHRAPRLWHRLMTRLLGLRIHVHGKPVPTRPLLLAANHVSWTDIMVLGATVDVHFIAKAEVAGWPVFGWLARLQRSIFVDRTQPRSAGEQAKRIAARLASGKPMVLFAEGTTSDGNHLLAFKSSLFAAAQMAMGQKAGVAVQPVAIIYTKLHGMKMGRRQRMKMSWIGDQTLVPHLLARLAGGVVDVELHFGEPIMFDAGIDRKRVAREAQWQVRKMIAAARSRQ